MGEVVLVLVYPLILMFVTLFVFNMLLRSVVQLINWMWDAVNQ